MIPQPLTIDSFTEGDHFPLVGPISITHGGEPPTAALVKVVIRFKQGASVVELASDVDDQITIDNLVTWTGIRIPRQAVALLTAGVWTFQVKFTDADEVVDTYIEDTLTIRPNV